MKPLMFHNNHKYNLISLKKWLNQQKNLKGLVITTEVNLQDLDKEHRWMLSIVPTVEVMSKNGRFFSKGAIIYKNNLK